MDRKMIMEHLVRAEEHVTLGETHIQRQRATSWPESKRSSERTSRTAIDCGLNSLS